MTRQRAISILLAIFVGSCAPQDEIEVSALEGDAASAPAATPRSPLDPAEPLQLGQLPDGATAAQAQALWWVNSYRVRAGLAPIDQLRTLNQAAGAHASYVLKHPDLYDELQMSVHEEDPDREGFTGARFWERMAEAGYDGLPFREVIAYQSQPAAAVAHWMETVYHRLPLLHPSAQHLGYAEAAVDSTGLAAGTSRINVLDIGAGDGAAPMVPSGVVWPPDGATQVPLSWDGLESPQPRPPPAGYPSGPVVTLTFGLDVALEVHKHDIYDLDGDPSAPLEHIFLTPENDEHLSGESSVALYSHVPLEPGHTYKVVVVGVVEGAPFHRAWTFRTRPQPGCSLLQQDCGVGKACYGTNESDAVCAWAGVRSGGESCDYQNDCSAGFTCVGGACRRYCSLDSGGQACSATCQDGYSGISSGGDLGVCATPKS